MARAASQTHLLRAAVAQVAQAVRALMLARLALQASARTTEAPAAVVVAVPQVPRVVPELWVVLKAEVPEAVVEAPQSAVPVESVESAGWRSSPSNAIRTTRRHDRHQCH